MSTQNDGGPAVPVTVEGNQGPVAYPGMTLRDYFAGQALVGFLSSYANPGAFAVPQTEEWANKAYQYADAMLAARSGERK